MIVEHVDRRVLGALRFVDAVTGLRVTGPLVVHAAGLRMTRNRSGDCVILHADGLEAHTEAFAAPPEAPPVASLSFEVVVRDPSGHYLPRRVTLVLPRDADPDRAAAVDSLFRAAEVPMYRAPSAAIAPGWAVVRASVPQTLPEEDEDISLPRPGLAGALIRVVRESDDVVLARGLTDARGEALVVVAGIPVTTWEESDDEDAAVLAHDVAVRLEVVHDAAAGLPDPEDLEERRAELVVRSASATLASGRVVVVRV